MTHRPRILIVGLFLDKEKNIPTQAFELSNVLRRNGYNVLSVSDYKNKILRLLHTVFFIVNKRKQFDVGIVQVYTGLNIIWAYVAAYLIKFQNKKLIFTIRGGALPDRMKIDPGTYLRLLRKADVITCPSNFMVRSLKKYNLHTVLIENVIQVQDYKSQHKNNLQPVLFWMRAFSPVYNPIMAVNVINELKNTYNYKNVKLYMGGPDMGLMQKARALIDQHKLRDNIELVGFVNMRNKLYFAKQCDIYMCTNNIDNAPVSFLEMMALGLPIVSTNVGGIPDLVTDNETALLVDKGDYKEMAKKIDDLLNNTALSKNLIQNGEKCIDTFSEKSVYKKWHDLLGKI